MMSSIEELLKEVQELPYSSIGKEITMEDASAIWRSVGYFIRHNLKHNKSVILPAIGKFTIEDIKLSIAHNPSRYLCKRVPIFQISSKLASHFRMKYPANQLGGPLPQVTVNRSAITCYCRRSRLKVDECIKEIVAYVYRRLAVNLPVTLPLYKVGILMLKSERCKMIFENRFLRDFQEIDVIKEISEENLHVQYSVL